MDENSFEKNLRNLAESYLKDVPRRHSLQTDNCLTITRMRQLAFDPYVITKTERDHLSSGCAFCNKFMPIAKRELWHPNPVDAFLYQAGKYKGEDAVLIRDHLERDRCRRCLRIDAVSRKVSAVKAILELATEGAVEVAREKIAGLAWGIETLFSPAPIAVRTLGAVRVRGGNGSWSVVGQQRSADGKLRYSLEEKVSGEKRFHVETEEPTLADSLVRFDIFDAAMDRGIFSGLIILARREGEERYEAVTPLPSVKTELPHPGFQEWQVFAYAIRAEDFTPRDVDLLETSIQGIPPSDASELAAYKGWIRKAFSAAGTDKDVKKRLNSLLNILE
jgi:hypothetical protein